MGKKEFLPKSKICSGCGKRKLQEEFSLNITSSDGLCNWCKECNNKKNQQYTYGITEAQYELMLKSQNGVCAICGRSETSKHQNGKIKRLSVDHNHKTYKIRGLLCQCCNAAIGMAKDDPKVLRKAAEYLEK